MHLDGISYTINFKRNERRSAKFNQDYFSKVISLFSSSWKMLAFWEGFHKTIILYQLSRQMLNKERRIEKPLQTLSHML